MDKHTHVMSEKVEIKIHVIGDGSFLRIKKNWIEEKIFQGHSRR